MKAGIAVFPTDGESTDGDPSIPAEVLRGLTSTDGHVLLAQKLRIPIAAGENCATVRAAEDYIDHAGLRFLQIDAGRIGGITPARKACELARQRGVLALPGAYFDIFIFVNSKVSSRNANSVFSRQQV